MEETWKAISAGTKHAVYPHPLAIKALAEIRIEHAGQSKYADEYKGDDSMITGCDDAAEKCPVWLGNDKCTHIGFDNPSKTVGTDDQVLAVFRRARDKIAGKIPVYIKSISAKWRGISLAVRF